MVLLQTFLVVACSKASCNMLWLFRWDLTLSLLCSWRLIFLQRKLIQNSQIFPSYRKGGWNHPVTLNKFKLNKIIQWVPFGPKYIDLVSMRYEVFTVLNISIEVFGGFNPVQYDLWLPLCKRGPVTPNVKVGARPSGERHIAPAILQQVLFWEVATLISIIWL